MTTSTRTTTQPHTDRLQLTMLDEAATYLRDYAEREDVTNAEAVRRALQLLALVDEMKPTEILVVVDEETQNLQAVELPWRARLARKLPAFGNARTRRPRSRAALSAVH